MQLNSLSDMNFNMTRNIRMGSGHEKKSIEFKVEQSQISVEGKKIGVMMDKSNGSYKYYHPDGVEKQELRDIKPKDFLKNLFEQKTISLNV
jgi:hypothetical protein